MRDLRESRSQFKDEAVRFAHGLLRFELCESQWLTVQLCISAMRKIHRLAPQGLGFKVQVVAQRFTNLSPRERGCLNPRVGPPRVEREGRCEWLCTGVPRSYVYQNIVGRSLKKHRSGYTPLSPFRHHSQDLGGRLFFIPSVLQEYLAHQKTPTLLRPPQDPRHGPAVGS